MLGRFSRLAFAACAAIAHVPSWADRKEVHYHHHHHYYYLPSGAVIERHEPPAHWRAQPPPPPHRSHPGAGAFPRESPVERDAARDRRRQILEKELAVEQELLARARKDAAREAIELHERNIAALLRELNHAAR